MSGRLVTQASFDSVNELADRRWIEAGESPVQRVEAATSVVPKPTQLRFEAVEATLDDAETLVEVIEPLPDTRKMCSRELDESLILLFRQGAGIINQEER